jgi:hypothetical protein
MLLDQSPAPSPTPPDCWRSWPGTIARGVPFSEALDLAEPVPIDMIDATTDYEPEKPAQRQVIRPAPASATPASARDKLGKSQKRWLPDNRERLHFPFKLMH